MGFIGSHTVVELHNSGHQPIIIDNLSNSQDSVLAGIKNITGKKFPFYQADCNDAAAMDKVFSEHEIHGVIHFAAYKAVGESVQKPLAYYQNNVGSLMVLLDTMRKHGCSLLIFSSSCTVYGQPELLPVTETSPKQPAMSPYGNTKQVCEEVIEDESNTGDFLRAISLRYFNPIGAHPSGAIVELPIGVPNNLVPFITQSVAGLRGPLTVFGTDYQTSDGTCVRDYIHVVDLAKAHVASLEYLENKPDVAFDIFNIGTGQGNTVLEVIKAFEAATGLKVDYSLGDRRPGDVEKVYADVTKSKEQLGWQTVLSLQEALNDAWVWQKNLQKD